MTILQLRLPALGAALMATALTGCTTPPQLAGSPAEPNRTTSGAIIGGILGNQVGKGSGRDAATVVGAIAGGVAGNEIEKDVRSAPRYEITVRMENGRRLVYTQRDSFGLRDGDYVRAEGNQVVPYR